MNGIAAAAAAGDFVHALELAVLAWRVTRDPMLADLIDVIAARVPATPIDERDYHKNWLAIARADRTADLGALLAGLRKALPRKARPFSTESQLPASWLERMSALAARRDDPRIVKPLIAAMYVDWPGYGDHVVELYAAPMLLVARAADVRAVPQLEALDTAGQEQSVSHLKWIVPKVVTPVLDELRARTVPPADADVAKLLERYRPEVPPAAARVPELYAMVYANPDDDGARQVLADVLLEIGDPRGELIALQLAASTEATAVRIASLLRNYRASWLGDLDAVLKNVVFERGFVVEAALESNAKATAVVWERAARDERLATIRHLYKGNGNEKHYSAFVFSPAMHHLRTVELLSSKMIAHVLEARSPWPFEHIILAKEPNPKQSLNLAVTKLLPAWSKLTVATRLEDIEALVIAIEPLLSAHGLAEVCLDNPGERLLPAWFALVDRFAPTVIADRRIRVYRQDGALVVEHTRTQLTTMHPDTIERHVAYAVPNHDRVIVR